MNAFKEAAKQQVEGDLVCPKCGEVNLPNRKPGVELIVDEWTAACCTCGHSGPAKDFQPKGQL